MQEDEAGSLQTSVEELMARGRRKRYLHPDIISRFLTCKHRLLAPAAAVRRAIIRHVILLIDLSAAMMDRDMRPTRFDLTLQYAREFILEWFDQNPLGQIGIIGMRAGLGEHIGDLAGEVQLSDCWMPVLTLSRQPTRGTRIYKGATQAGTYRGTKFTKCYRNGQSKHEVRLQL